MAGTKMDEPLDVDFVDDPQPETKADPKQDAKSEPKADPKPAAGDPKPTTPAPDAPAPDAPAAEPKPSVGERIGNGLGFPKEELGKIKSEPWDGAKGFFKAQWNVTPQAVENVAAAKAAAKAGRDAVKAEGATAESVAAAKQSARDGVKLAAGELFTKVGAVKMASRAVPVLGSLYSAYAAFNSFKEGRIVAGVLDMIGIIPGPVGWVAMAASWAWKTWGEDNIGKWDAPDGSSTFMLPASAADVTGVSAADQLIRQAQGAVFSFQDGPTGSVWDSNAPKALRIDTPAVQKALEDWLGGIAALFLEIDKTMTQANEDYFQQQRQKLAPHLSAMSKLKAESRNVMTELKAASDGAGEAYKAVLGANAAARGQLADDGELKDQAGAITAETLLEKGKAKMDAAETKLGQVFGETPAVVVEPAVGTVAAPAATPTPKSTPTPTPLPQQTAPQPTTPGNTPKQESPSKTDDALKKLMEQLNKTQTPTTPTSNLGGGNPLGNSGLGQGLGGNQGGGTPLSQAKPQTTSEPKKLVEDKKPREKREEKEEPKKEEKKPLTNTKAEQEKAAVPAAEPKPAAAPAVGPVAAAPTPAQQNAAHAAKAEEKPNNDVDVKGNKTTFPDPKTAKMAQLLAAADPTHPKSLADAAAEAGLKPPTPGQDPGQQIPPSDAKPGDVMVAGEKKYMLLGDGKFYDLQEYKVVGADELPKEMGDRAGYFRLQDANPGQPGPGAGQQPGGAVPVSNPQGPQGPISPQSQTAPAHQVPGATGAPQGPVSGNPTPAGMPPAAPGGVQSAGSPGVPKPGQGGPANASATDSGTGVGGPSTAGGQRLDPGAVR